MINVLTEVWDDVKDFKNKNLLMKAFKLNPSNLIFTDSIDNSFRDFFGTHTSIKVLTEDINAPLAVLMFQQLNELYEGVEQLSMLAQRLYQDSDKNINNGVKVIEVQMIMANMLLEKGVEVFTALLNYNGGEDSAVFLREKIISVREQEQKMYQKFKSLEPFKLVDLNECFIDTSNLTNKMDKENLNNAMHMYPAIVWTMRAFSSFLTLMPYAIKMPSRQNYLAEFIKVEMNKNTRLRLDDTIFEYFAKKTNYKNYSECVDSVNSLLGRINPEVLEFVKGFEETHPYLIHDSAFKIKINSLEAVNSFEVFEDINLDDVKNIKDRLSSMQEEYNERNLSKFVIKNKFFINDVLSFESKKMVGLNDDLLVIPKTKYQSFASLAGDISLIYETHIKEDKDTKNVKVVHVFPEQSKLIKKELKNIPKNLLFGNNIKYMKDLFSTRKNAEVLNKKLEIFYKTRLMINSKYEKENMCKLDSLTNLRSLYKGVEVAMHESYSLFNETLRYIELKAMTNTKKTDEKKVKKKKI